MFRKGSLGRKIAVGAFAGSLFVGGGAAMVYRRRLQENRSITAEDFNAAQNQTELKTALENMFAPAGTPNKPLIKLYRYTTCPFCGMVKAFLDYHKIEHELVEVEPMFKKQLGEIGYKKVPNLQFIVTGHWGPFISDSEIIVNTLSKYVGKGVEKQVTDEEVLKWRKWSRQQLVKYLVLNLNDSLFNAWMSYSYIDQFDTIPTFNKYFLKIMGAPVMFLVAKLMTAPTLKKQGLLKDDDNIRDVLMGSVNKFTTEALTTGGTAEGKGAKTRAFHGGEKPDLADLDVYGVLQSIRGHVIYDDIYTSTAIKPWLDRMDNLTGKTPYVVMHPDQMHKVGK